MCDVCTGNPGQAIDLSKISNSKGMGTSLTDKGLELREKGKREGGGGEGRRILQCN